MKKLALDGHVPLERRAKVEGVKSMVERTPESSPVDREALIAAIQGPCQPFPVAAVAAIAARREEFLPAILRLLQEAVDDPERIIAREHSYGPTIALYLLAEWREKSAFQTILKAFSHRGETTSNLWGDVIHELGKIIVSTFDGDLDSLIALMRNAENDEYVRVDAFYGLSSLYLFGVVARDRFLAITRDLLAEFDPARTYSPGDQTWFSGMVAGCARLNVAELEPEVKRLYDHEMVDTFWVRFEDFQEGVANPYQEDISRTDHQYTLITSAVEELKDWACFRDPAREAVEKPPKLSPKACDKALKTVAASHDEPPPPALPPPAEKFPVAGRNDPCPCGSGKKYKKCCLS